MHTNDPTRTFRFVFPNWPVGQKNHLFMGSEGEGKAAAIAYTLIETAKLNGVDPQAWLTDTVWIPPGEKHWHGAAPSNGMVHLAFQEALDGKHVAWMEHVTDAEYGVAPERCGRAGCVSGRLHTPMKDPVRCAESIPRPARDSPQIQHGFVEISSVLKRFVPRLARYTARRLQSETLPQPRTGKILINQ